MGEAIPSSSQQSRNEESFPLLRPYGKQFSNPLQRSHERREFKSAIQGEGLRRENQYTGRPPGKAESCIRYFPADYDNDFMLL